MCQDLNQVTLSTKPKDTTRLILVTPIFQEKKKTPQKGQTACLGQSVRAPSKTQSQKCRRDLPLAGPSHMAARAGRWDPDIGRLGAGWAGRSFPGTRLWLSAGQTDHTHFPGEDIEAQRSAVTCPRSWDKDTRARTSPEGL